MKISHFLNYVTFLVGMVTVLSCRSINSVEQTCCDLDSLHTSEQMSGQKIDVYPTDSVQSIYVVGNIEAILFSRQDNRPVLELVNNLTHRKIETDIKYGAAAGEMLNADFSMNDGMLSICDFIRNEVIECDLQAVSEGGSFEPRLRKVRYDSQEIISVRGGKPIHLNPSSFDGVSPRIVREGHIANRDLESFGVVDGSLICSKDRGTIVFFDRFNPQIEFLTYRGRLLKRIAFPSFFEQRYMTSGFGKTSQRYFESQVPQYFTSATNTEQYIFAAFSPASFSPSSGDTYYLDYDAIIKLDWDGNVIDVYNIPCRIKCISADEGLLYVWGRWDGYDALVKYCI